MFHFNREFFFPSFLSTAWDSKTVRRAVKFNLKLVKVYSTLAHLFISCWGRRYNTKKRRKLEKTDVLRVKWNEEKLIKSAPSQKFSLEKSFSVEFSDFLSSFLSLLILVVLMLMMFVKGFRSVQTCLRISHRKHTTKRRKTTKALNLPFTLRRILSFSVVYVDSKLFRMIATWEINKSIAQISTDYECYLVECCVSL